MACAHQWQNKRIKNFTLQYDTRLVVFDSDSSDPNLTKADFKTQYNYIGWRNALYFGRVRWTNSCDFLVIVSTRTYRILQLEPTPSLVELWAQAIHWARCAVCFVLNISILYFKANNCRAIVRHSFPLHRHCFLTLSHGVSSWPVHLYPQTLQRLPVTDPRGGGSHQTMILTRSQWSHQRIRRGSLTSSSFQMILFGRHQIIVACWTLTNLEYRIVRCALIIAWRRLQLSIRDRYLTRLRWKWLATVKCRPMPSPYWNIRNQNLYHG